MINVNPAIDNFSSLTKSRKLFEFVSNFEICILIMIVYFTCLSVSALFHRQILYEFSRKRMLWRIVGNYKGEKK